MLMRDTAAFLDFQCCQCLVTARNSILQKFSLDKSLSPIICCQYSRRSCRTYGRISPTNHYELPPLASLSRHVTIPVRLLSRFNSFNAAAPRSFFSTAKSFMFDAMPAYIITFPFFAAVNTMSVGSAAHHTMTVFSRHGHISRFDMPHAHNVDATKLAGISQRSYFDGHDVSEFRPHRGRFRMMTYDFIFTIFRRPF